MVQFSEMSGNIIIKILTAYILTSLETRRNFVKIKRPRAPIRDTPRHKLHVYLLTNAIEPIKTVT